MLLMVIKKHSQPELPIELIVAFSSAFPCQASYSSSYVPVRHPRLRGPPSPPLPGVASLQLHEGAQYAMLRWIQKAHIFCLLVRLYEPRSLYAIRRSKADYCTTLEPHLADPTDELGDAALVYGQIFWFSGLRDFRFALSMWRLRTLQYYPSRFERNSDVRQRRSGHFRRRYTILDEWFSVSRGRRVCGRILCLPNQVALVAGL